MNLNKLSTHLLKRTYHALLLTSVIALTLSACIATAPAATTTATTESTTASAVTETVSSAAAITQTVVTTDAVAVAVVAAEGGTRLFTHAMGETEIPLHPQRVVVLDAVDNLLALGVRPVGAAQWMGTNTGMEASWPSYIDPAVYDGITFLGSNQQPNLELLVGLNPDLIIGRERFHAEIYPQLSAIAPTVLDGIEGGSGTWRQEFFFQADVLGKTAEAEKLMAEYEARAAGIAERLQQLEVNPEVSAARFDPEQISMYQEHGHFLGEVLFDAGVRRPANQMASEGQVKLSLEEISQLDADVIFPIESNPNQSRYQEIVDTPLWDQLRAVQNGRVYPVAFDLWVGGWTITGAHHILDDLETYLLAPENP